jgi:toxin ParE1/3/4
MKCVAVLRPAAEEELNEARAWYEARQRGLGEELVACVDAALEQSCFAPEMGARVHGQVRRVLIRRFPYGVFYVVEPGRIVVLAIFHASRDPVDWRAGR